ncbi:MAG: hypothetical protein Q9225_002781 [Loekoesia sp. 1 TL-2023]
MEALGTSRRDHISTHEINDGHFGRLSLRDMERHRRINQAGTRESAVSDDVKQKLNGWNSAWTRLKDDGILEEGLEDLNAGQSHRERLLSEPPRQPPVDALEEAKQFARQVGASRSRGSGRGGRGGGVAGSKSSRNAQRRIPAGEEPMTKGQPQSGSRVILPSITGRPKAPEPRKTDVKNPQVSGKAASADKSSSTAQASSPKPSPKGVTFPTAQPAMGTLLDTGVHQANDQAAAFPSKSYADDLLDMEFEQSTNLPAPMQVGAKVKENEIHPGASSAQPDLRQFESQMASFFPLLQSMLPPDAIEKIASVRLQVQQKINNMDDIQAGPTSQPSGTSLEQSADLKQSAALDRTRPVQSVSKEDNGPPRSLANTVEQRTREWSQRVIANTVSTRDSILGDHVTQPRWVGRHRSTTSVTSTSGLVEGIKQLHIDDKQPSVVPQATEDTAQYAKINPFGPKPNITGQTVSSTTQVRHGDVVEPQLSRHATRPQLPDFLPPTDTPEDHGAAARAQYAKAVPARTNESVSSPTATVGAREVGVYLAQKPLAVRRDAAPSLPAGSSDAADQRNQRKDSVSSAGTSQISPGLGEDIVRSHRASEPRTFNQAIQPPSGPFNFVAPFRPPHSSSNLHPPSFLTQSAQPVRDPGAAARGQYGQTATQPTSSGPKSTGLAATGNPPYIPAHATAQRERDVPTSSGTFTKLTSAQQATAMSSESRGSSSAGPTSNPQDPSLTPRYLSGARPAQFSRNTRPAPPLPEWLPSAKTTDDPAAAARKQYGGKENQKI